MPDVILDDTGMQPFSNMRRQVSIDRLLDDSVGFGATPAISAIAASGDDVSNTDTDDFSITDTFIRIGAFSFERNAAFRFALNVAKDTFIESAHIDFVASATLSSGGVNLTIAIEQVDNASQIPNATTFNAAVRGTTVAWAPAGWNIGTTNSTVNFASILQTHVNRAGWSSGNFINVFIETTGSTTRRELITWDDDSGTDAPQLLVTPAGIEFQTFVEIGRILGDVITIGTEIQDVEILMGSTNGNFGRFRATSGGFFARDRTETGDVIGFPWGSILRVANVQIPRGARVTKAVFEGKPWNGSTPQTEITVRTIFKSEATDDSVMPTDVDEVLALFANLNPGSVTWNNIGDWTSDLVDETTIDFSAVVQEVIDRPGWNVGQDLTIVWLDDGSDTNARREFGGSPADGISFIYSYDPAVTTADIVRTHHSVGWIESPVKIMPMNDVLQTPQYIRTRIL